MFSDDDDSTKTMLLTDVCLGNQISLARYEIPPEGVPDYDTVSGYRLTFYPPGVSHSYLFIYSSFFVASDPNYREVVKRKNFTGG